MEAFNPRHVQAALDALGIGIQVRFFDDSTATSQLAAEQIGCELGQIAKSIVFIVEDQPLVVVTSGDQRVDERKLATRYAVSRKKVRVATAEQCIAITGYAPGGVPPLGYRTADLPVLLDDFLRRYAVVYAAGGAHNAIFPVAIEQLEIVTNGTYADVRREA